jgi:chromosome partitioning protein
MPATTVSLINMKGGVGKTTLAFNLAWYCAWRAKKKVLAVDVDPQANLSQYFMGAKDYLAYLEGGKNTVVEIFEQFSAPRSKKGSPTLITPKDVIHKLYEWSDGSLLHLVPSRLELAWTLKNPTEKAQLLPQFLAEVSTKYELIVIDCAPTESILTTAAYQSSRYIVVPVRAEFLATIGLPLLERSLAEFRIMRRQHEIGMAGVVFNDTRRVNAPPEQRTSRKEVIKVAREFGWPVFDNDAYHSDSYPVGSRSAKPIFLTKHARGYVAGEFSEVAEEFLRAIGFR